MKTNISTTKEQSQRLLRCGVSADTADMFYTNYPNKPNDGIPYIGRIGIRKDLIPAWSLSAMLGLLPSYLEDFPFTKWIEPFGDGEICEKGDESTLSGYVRLYRNETHWIVDYDWDGFTGTLPQSENPIEACVRAIELLYANGYKFNEI